MAVHDYDKLDDGLAIKELTMNSQDDIKDEPKFKYVRELDNL